MEKYAIIQCVDGNFTVVSEWNDSEKAKKAYHTLCAALWNDKSFAKGYAAILDTQLDIYQGYKELIQHEVVQTPPAEPRQKANNFIGGHHYGRREKATASMVC